MVCSVEDAVYSYLSTVRLRLSVMNWSMLVVLKTLSVLSGAGAFLNFFSLSGTPHTARQMYGNICFRFDEYTPTCGWNIFLSASVNLSGIMTDGVKMNRRWDNLFDLTPTLCNRNLSDRPKDLCLKTTLYGTFALNVKPIVLAGWSKVCNDSTKGLLEYVSSYSGVNIGDTKTPVDSTYFNRTNSVPSSVPSMLGICPEFGSVMSTSGSLEQQGNVCYTGGHKVTFPKTYSTNGCCSLCVFYPNCLGVNVWLSRSSCDVITENTDLNPGLTSPVLGCSYWKLTNRV